MNMKQFQYALVLSTEGSFSKAADVLHISQPSLSQYIKKIESQLGVELFIRTNGNVRLTDAGKIYIDAGEKILDLENQMHNHFLDIAEHKEGSITIGTTPFRSTTLMPTIVAAFKKIYPGIYIIIAELETQELKEATENGKFDFSILTLPIDEDKFRYELILEDEFVIAVPENSKLNQTLSKHCIHITERKYPVIDISLLNHEDFIMVSDGQVMQKRLSSLCLKYNLELNRVAEVNSLETQIALVRKGIGAALVPSSIHCSTANTDNVAYYSLRNELPRGQVVVIYRKQQYLSQVHRDFLSIIKTIYA